MSLHNFYLRMASLMAERATCPKLSVGAIIVREGRIISTGYNGAPKGMIHCTEAMCEEDASGACVRAVHAEANAIAFAAKYGVSTGGATLYITHGPCRRCAQLIINSGISTIVIRDPYRDDSGWKLLKIAGLTAISIQER